MATEEGEDAIDYTEPCSGPRCKICSSIVPGPDVKGKTFTCRSQNVVYLITSPDGKQKYVGITTRSMSDRMSKHRHSIKSGSGDGEKFIKYYQKHEFEQASITIIDEGTDKTNLEQKENRWIRHYDSLRNGLNSQL